MMTMTAPEWLTRRGGELRQRYDGSWAVVLNGAPQYVLALTPAAGKHSCKVTQTNNGQRLDSGSVHPTEQEALQAGLEDLRKTLGW
jgi:hypothetical protein